MAGGEGCRDERRGSSASEVGTVDRTAKKEKKKKKKILIHTHTHPLHTPPPTQTPPLTDPPPPTHTHHGITFGSSHRLVRVTCTSDLRTMHSKASHTKVTASHSHIKTKVCSLRTTEQHKRPAARTHAHTHTHHAQIYLRQADWFT